MQTGQQNVKLLKRKCVEKNEFKTNEIRNNNKKTTYNLSQAKKKNVYENASFTFQELRNPNYVFAYKLGKKKREKKKKNQHKENYSNSITTKVSKTE